MAKDKLSSIPAPRENHRLFGFDAVEARFREEFAGGKPHHAYLMTGPKGIGKATLAYRFARHILSIGALKAPAIDAGTVSLFGDPVTPSAPTPEQQEALFRRIAAGSHTDLLVLSPAFDKRKGEDKTTISVEDARKVPDFLSLTPAEGDWRVVIIDAVDQMTGSAANALLKILEEPPAQAILLLVCHAPGTILPTIKSRCRKLALDAPSRAAFDQALAAIAPGIDPSNYAALHALSDGSPGLAITLDTYDGLKWYRQWLEVLQPGASASARQKVADSAHATKSPDAWRTLLHAWQVAIARISLWPHASGAPVLHGEAEMLASIAEPLERRVREAWAERARNLIAATDIFNLEKRQTIAMLMQPALLDKLAA